MKPLFTIEAAPMQGFLDHGVRSACARFFGGVDVWYAPFLQLEKGRLRSRDKRELAEGRKEGTSLILQVAPSTSDEAWALKQIIVDAGYTSVNLNLGCPYPMVTRRKKGAGLLVHPETVADILETLCYKGDAVSVSVKTRIGLHHEDEFRAIIPVLNGFPLEKVIVHPRIASEQYGGWPHWEVLDRTIADIKAPVIANGDIQTERDARQILDRYPGLGGMMIGRGFLRDPFLAMRIKHIPLPENPAETLRAFHDAVFENCRAFLASSHLVTKMTAFWAYFADGFPNGDKVFKKFKKSKNAEMYLNAVDFAFDALSSTQPEKKTVLRRFE